MKFSKRPQPMNFGGPDGEPREAAQAQPFEPPGREPELVGFRPLDAAGQDGPMAIHGFSTVGFGCVAGRNATTLLAVRVSRTTSA